MMNDPRVGKSWKFCRPSCLAATISLPYTAKLGSGADVAAVKLEV